MEKIVINENNKFNSRDITKWIRQTLKEEYPNCKFSVTHESFSGNVGRSIDVALMKSDLRIIKPIEKLTEDNMWFIEKRNYSLDDLKRTYAKTYHQLNYFSLLSNYNEDEWNNGVFLTQKGHYLLQNVVKIMSKHNWDKSDSQIDYVDMNYYMGLSLGKYDKPFVDGEIDG